MHVIFFILRRSVDEGIDMLSLYLVTVLRAMSTPKLFNMSHPFFEITDTEFIKEFMANKNDWTLDCNSLFEAP